MADEAEPLASTVDYIHCSSTHVETLTDSKFAREGDTFTGGDVQKSHPVVDSADFEMDLNDSGEFFLVCADCEAKRDLGFVPSVGVNKLSEVELEQFEPPRKKSRVSEVDSPRLRSGKSSPFVKCSENLGIDGEGKGKEIVIYRGNLKVEIVSPLCCVVPDSVSPCSKKLDFEGGKNGKSKIGGENLANNKLEFNIHEENEGNGKSEVNVNGDKVDESAKFKETEDHGDEKFKANGSMKYIFDALRILATKKDYDDSEIDIFEMAKRRGMTFPRSRFWVGEENGEKVET